MVINLFLLLEFSMENYSLKLIMANILAILGCGKVGDVST